MSALRSTRVAAAVGIVVTLAGCTTAPAVEAFDPSALGPSTVTPGTLALPLDVVLARSVAEVTAIRDAKQDIIRSCMAEAGFDYVVLPSQYDPSQTSRWYGVTDPESAAVYGFRPPWAVAVPGTGESGDSAGGAAVQFSPAELLALQGDESSMVDVTAESGEVIARYDPQSCWGRAMDEVEPDWATSYQIQRIAEGIASEAAMAAEASEAVQQGFAEWSACMADKGFDYSDPLASNNSIWPGDVPSADEIRTAVADAECKYSIGLLTVWSTEIARAQHEALSQHPGLLTTWATIQGDALSNAQGM